jgi:hypothetical protein
MFIRDSVTPRLGLFLSGQDNAVCLHDLTSQDTQFNWDNTTFAVTLETNQGNSSESWTVCYENEIRKVKIFRMKR